MNRKEFLEARAKMHFLKTHTVTECPPGVADGVHPNFQRHHNVRQSSQPSTQNYAQRMVGHEIDTVTQEPRPLSSQPHTKGKCE